MLYQTKELKKKNQYLIFKVLILIIYQLIAFNLRLMTKKYKNIIKRLRN